MGQRRGIPQSLSPGKAGIFPQGDLPILLHLFTEQTQTGICGRASSAEKRTQKGRKELGERHSLHSRLFAINF
jgi:hypothetical protein